MTTEKNESPAPREPENPWAFLESPPKEEPEHDDDVLRLKDVSASWLARHILKTGCFTLMILFAAFIGCCTIIDSGFHHDADKILGDASDCISQLHQIGDCLYYLTHPDKMEESLRDKVEPVEITPDMTVDDLIREALRQDILDGGPGGKYLCCARTGEPYLVFPAPASALLQEPEPHKRIPVVMDPPHAHDESRLLTFICRLFYGHCAKYISTARVLYADGGSESISCEEAEELVRKYHPEPLNPSQDTMSGQDNPQSDKRPE